MSGTTFPVGGPSTVTQQLPAYLYEQYADDPDLQALFEAYNRLAQGYLDSLNALNLPVYTAASISGLLLDWVAAGLYGMTRPSLPAARARVVGPFNTWAYNTIGYNGSRAIDATTYYATSDDVFKRILTWHFYKGDGKVFSLVWLKRRIARFLSGDNGTAPNIDNTYQISVSFGVGNQVNINLLFGVRQVTGGAVYNRFGYNTTAYNSIRSTFRSFTPLANAAVFAAAVAARALELPFQFTWVVSIDSGPPAAYGALLTTSSGFFLTTEDGRFLATEP